MEGDGGFRIGLQLLDVERWIEPGLLDVLRDEGIGCIVFSPLAQGLLTDRYLAGIAEGSRASKANTFLRPEQLTDRKLSQVRRLQGLAQARRQSMAQLALAWVLRHPEVTSALIGASRTEQIDDAAGALKNLSFEPDELAAIDAILADEPAGAGPLA